MKTRWLFLFLLSWGLNLASFSSLMSQENKEFREVTELQGTIISPAQQGKLALSSGDKISVFLEKSQTLKIGDPFEIFQESLIGPKVPLYRKIGEATILQIVNDKLVIAIIDSSANEVMVGDKVYLPGKNR
jgi:hypothetical protein